MYLKYISGMSKLLMFLLYGKKIKINYSLGYNIFYCFICHSKKKNNNQLKLLI